MLHLTFPTHLAVGYLLGVYSRFPVAYLVVGSVLPDLVDRPLYWLGLTPFTHTVAHSIAVAVPAGLVLIRLFGRRGAALSLGWLVHIGTDFLNVTTTQGLAATPYYVLYLGPPPDEREAFETVTIVLPATDVTHTLHPVVLALEVAVLSWAVAAILRERNAPSRLRDTEAD
ncbi:hydrolase [Natronococcus sp.]|uniref:hydrolase n=1 Tax=Natronococcus sp. TaxID=35747 RepID=UPI003A4D6357